ncbi:hypothetical protein QTO34_017233 [Cnephaeus nilssonii]|uniref:Translocation protein SEC62 n=1 Tax=Cnephaeus nilssonii TaxID=3371016 RepID=A0AA40I0N2_CNENI|nr:hypothetical protein QTO34_017233 [Eptesicus nilssonii]
MGPAVGGTVLLVVMPPGNLGEQKPSHAEVGAQAGGDSGSPTTWDLEAQGWAPQAFSDPVLGFGEASDIRCFRTGKEDMSRIQKALARKFHCSETKVEQSHKPRWSPFHVLSKEIGEPTKEENSVAKYLQFNCPTKPTNMMGHPVDYFTSSKAVDCPLDSNHPLTGRNGSRCGCRLFFGQHPSPCCCSLHSISRHLAHNWRKGLFWFLPNLTTDVSFRPLYNPI